MNHIGQQTMAVVPGFGSSANASIRSLVLLFWKMVRRMISYELDPSTLTAECVQRWILMLRFELVVSKNAYNATYHYRNDLACP